MDKYSFIHYKTGILALDEQHWELFTILNEMRAAQACNDVIKARTLLNYFSSKLSEHGVFEEYLMRSCGYPYFDFHLSHHPESFKQLKRYCDTKAIHGDILCTDIVKISTLLSEHIDHYDIQFGVWYTKNINK